MMAPLFLVHRIKNGITEDGKMKIIPEDWHSRLLLTLSNPFAMEEPDRPKLLHLVV